MNTQKKLYKALDVALILMEKEDVIRTSGNGSNQNQDPGTILVPDWN